ncbi:uncharacterized protein LOC128235194 isoform X2 [Mya arenaria]|uniref:uncharacterized protein LOC128235194 isoform X2 n=1 Tax=Mya arenaria TaxID=6604 RepID=UPI0022E96239|nr:uncharacterized protein LOC128235194 isoform X2 [Mya arenaria]
MSLSANERKHVWQDHSDSLTRIKTQLSDHQSPTKVRSPIRSPAGRQEHAPYGKYRQSTPPYLPRLETPPDERRKASNLRGNRYEIVPPLRESKRQQDSRSTDYDSWGEESDEEPDADPGAYMPQPFQYGPPPVVWGAPFPMFYPPPPPPAHQPGGKRRRGNENDDPRGRNDRYKSNSYGASRQPKSDRYEDVSRSVPSKAKKKSKPNRVHFSQPTPAPNGYYGYPMPGYMPYPYYPQPGEDPYGRQKDTKYKYIQPRDTPNSQNDTHGDMMSRFRDQPDRVLEYYMKDHPLFSENFVNWFVNRCLDDIIPDVLMDALNEIGQGPGAVENLALRIRDDIMGDELPGQMHDIVRATLNEMVDEHMLYSQSGDPLESFLTRLLNDAVHEAAGDIVKETVREMARDYVDDKHFAIVYDDLLDDYLDEVGTSIVQDTMYEIMYEDFIRDEVIEAELEELLPEIAAEVLTHYDTKVMRRELKEVSSHAGDKLIESIMLDYIMQLVARQGKVWTESDHASKYMDDIVSTILLEKLFGTIVNRRKTINNKPIRKIHQKVVTDVALDVCLQQLTSSLDEDLLDVDEYERGVMEPYVLHNTPMGRILTS